MLGNDTDKSWEALGRTDPYYGVLTCDSFRTLNLDANAKLQFFNSGREHMLGLLQRLEASLGPIPRGRALDFGCGVGRLALPLAQVAGFSRVTGVDVSASMLTEATRNARELKVDNVEFVMSTDDLQKVSGAYDFVHSFIVLQHIPVARGEKIILQLLERLSPGGVAALHMPFAGRSAWPRRASVVLRERIAILQGVANLLQGRPWNEPLMQMNRYNLNSLFSSFHERGFSHLTVELSTSGTNTDAYLFIRRKASTHVP